MMLVLIVVHNQPLTVTQRWSDCRVLPLHFTLSQCGFIYLFVYLVVMPYSRIIHFYDYNHHYGEKELSITQGKL